MYITPNQDIQQRLLGIPNTKYMSLYPVIIISLFVETFCLRFDAKYDCKRTGHHCSPFADSVSTDS